MRTNDFSLAPPMAQAGAVFVGATRFSGIRSLWELWRLWGPLKRRMEATPGFVFFRSWYQYPFTVGSLALFRDEAALAEFARSPEHVAAWKWVTGPGKADAGFIRIYRALDQGYTNGAWRAEQDQVPTR